MRVDKPFANDTAQPAPFHPVAFPEIWIVRPDYVNVMLRVDDACYKAIIIGATYQDIGQLWGGN
jgi:hypothetical protein